MKFIFYLLDITYRIENNIPIIYLYGRTNKGKVCIIDKNFKPYLWVKTKNIEDTKQRIKELENENIKILEISPETKIYQGEETRALKVHTEIPAMIPKLKEELKNAGLDYFEADILFTRRYLIDKQITPLQALEIEAEQITKKLKVPAYELKEVLPREEFLENPKILALDIECYPTMTRTMTEPILMLALYGKDYKKIITHAKIQGEYIEVVENEPAMLLKLKQEIENYDPDIITGYYSDGFDFPYIIERARHWKIKLDLGLDNSSVTLSGGTRPHANITGLPHVDVYNITRNVLSQALKTRERTLNAVAKELLNETKIDIDIMKLAEAWDNKDKELLTKFAEYNIVDSKLTYNLAEKLYQNMLEFVKILSIPITDTTRMPMSQMVEWYLIKNAHKQNIIVPNKPTTFEIQRRNLNVAKGAFVLEPTPGLYKDVLVFDFRSIYPTIIASHNLSPETFKKGPKEEGILVPLEDKDWWFSKTKPGFLSSNIEDLIKRRMRVKEIMKEKPSLSLKAREQALKLLANSFYGYLNFNMSRWYTYESAETTTAFGRYYITRVIDRMNKANYPVIYSDTDSIFVNCQNKDPQTVIDIVTEVNQELPGLMELEYEGRYPTAIFVATKGDKKGAKKRYAIIDQQDNITIKGFEAIRRNASKIAKEVQIEVLNILLKENNPEKAFNYLRDKIKQIRNNELPIEKFIITTQLTKDIDQYDSKGPHVIVAQRMKEKGMDIQPGTIIQYIVTVHGKKISEKARLPEETKQEEIDADYYINNQIIPALENIFEVFGYSSKDLTKDHKQKGLSEFF